MTNIHLIYPAIALMALTFMVMPLILATRLMAIKSGRIKMSYFRLSQSNDETVPEYMLQVTRHFANLFEMPVLFYFLSSISFTARISDPLIINLFWVYFGLRICHSFIHLTYNNPKHRVVPYVLSNIILVACFIRFLFIISY